MKVLRTLICAPILAVSFCGTLDAQINNTLYFMDIPQSNKYNPAFKPNSSFYLGFPIISPVRAGATSSSLAYGDVILRHPTEDSLITFLHPLADADDFLNQLKAVNYISSNLGTSLASFGFRTPVGYFSVDLNTRMDATLRYPGDLLDLLVHGTEDGREYSFDKMGIDASLFNELGIGWAMDLNPQWSAGARVKVLFGLSDLNTHRSFSSLTPSQEDWKIRTDFEIRASLGFAEVIYDDDGMIEEIIIDEGLEDLNTLSLARYAFGAGNLGAGLDLGVIYRPMEELTLSASVKDLGFIRWTEEVHNISFAMEYDYPGLEINPFEFTDDFTFSDYLDSTFTQLGDSLSGFLTMGPGDPYMRRLNTSLFIGASYQLIPTLSFGLVSRTDLLNDLITEHITLSANFSVLRLLDLSLSYSYMNSHFRNMGAGLQFNLGPFNMFMVSDNVLNLVFFPLESQAVNLWFGLNLMFGYKDRVDLPLIY